MRVRVLRVPVLEQGLLQQELVLVLVLVLLQVLVLVQGQGPRHHHSLWLR